MSEWLERFVDEELEGRGEKPDENKCQLCEVYYSSEFCRLEHLNGKRHQTSLLGEEKTRKSGCAICQVEYLSLSHMRHHLVGKAHHSNMKGTWKKVKK
jgi:hypothetical protein